MKAIALTGHDTPVLVFGTCPILSWQNEAEEDAAHILISTAGLLPGILQDAREQAQATTCRWRGPPAMASVGQGIRGLRNRAPPGARSLPPNLVSPPAGPFLGLPNDRGRP